MIGLTYDNARGHADVVFVDGQLVDDPGLITACLISLYTDKRDPSAPEGEREGWWGTQLDELGGEWGSLLWTLRRALPTEDTRQKAEGYATASLEWLKTDGYVETITAKAVWTKPNPGAADLAIEVYIKRPGDIAPRRLGVWGAFLGAQ